MSNYAEQLRREQEIYQDDDQVHDLPAAYHWWSERYVLPKLQSLGVASCDDFFTSPIVEIASRRQEATRVVSVGSGNGDLEVGSPSASRPRA